MQNQSYKNLISYDLLQKFNFTSLFFLKSPSSLSFNLNDKRSENNLIFSVPFYMVQRSLLGCEPVFSRLSKAVSNFKTRGGELHGAKGRATASMSCGVLVSVVSHLFCDVAELSPNINFGVTENNSLSIGFEDVKDFAVFSQLGLEYLNYRLGATFSFTFRQLKIMTRNEFVVFISAFILQKNQ